MLLVGLSDFRGAPGDNSAAIEMVLTVLMPAMSKMAKLKLLQLIQEQVLSTSERAAIARVVVVATDAKSLRTAAPLARGEPDSDRKSALRSAHASVVQVT